MKSFLKVIPFYKNEATLIQRAINSNREAQHHLYEMHAPKMLSVCRYYIKDSFHAEEVMLNGFLKVFAHLNNFRFEGSFEGWIRRIMVRECISYLRQQKQIVFSVEDTDLKDENLTSIQTDIEVEEIQNLIDALPDGYKVVFVMYAIEGYKHHEIASLLNITEGTSKSQLFKARKMLQEQIQKIHKTTGYGLK